MEIEKNYTKTGELLDKKNIFKAKYYSINLETHRLSNGKTIEYQTVDASDWVSVIPITEDNRLVMVYQYRAAWRRGSLEFCAGKCDKENDFLECAKRELREETGYIGKNWKLIGSGNPVTWTTQRVKIFAVTDLEITDTEFDEEEDIQVIIVDPKDFWNLVDRGDIIDIPTIASFAFLNRSDIIIT